MGIAIDEGGIQFLVGHVGVDYRGLRYPADVFPRFLLTTDWPKSERYRLTTDFMHRPVPVLLQFAHYEEPFLWSK